MRDLCVLMFLHVARVSVVSHGAPPNETWVAALAAVFLKHAKEQKLGTALLMHDRDTMFPESFDQALRSAGLQVTKASHCSPRGS